jgi:circadian clock protein KaiB
MPARKESPKARRSPAAPGKKRPGRYVLSLYVAGLNGRSEEAIRTITGFCDEHLKGRYQLGVIDIYQEPALARAARVFAVPTLVREHPLPLEKLVVPLADLDIILVGPDRKSRT